MKNMEYIIRVDAASGQYLTDWREESTGKLELFSSPKMEHAMRFPNRSEAEGISRWADAGCHIYEISGRPNIRP